jgi:hypothetical protein
MALREGVHEGDAQKELVKSTPSRATRSNAGVRMPLQP